MIKNNTPSQSHVTVRFHEIALKGGNRSFFVNMLVANIRRAVQGLGVSQVKKEQMMVGLSLETDSSWEEIKIRLAQVFGIVKFALAYKLPQSLDSLEEFVVRDVQQRDFKSFRITSKRADKSFHLKSIEIDRRLGKSVQALTGARVDLTKPELNIHIDVQPRQIIVYFDEIQGPGGLPVGTGGKVACLLSGGIDSPVAAYRMMKRGCRVVMIHFHSFPLVEGRSREKAQELTELLTRYQYESRLYMVPFANLQKQAILVVPGPFRVVLYRRLMVRIGQAIAERENAQALVTGESLGQVSSQTLENISTIDDAVTIPILRPLVGMDKQEIIEQSRTIGTYDISIMPDEDCCTLFVPKHPSTHTTIKELQMIEKNLDVSAMVREAVDNTDVLEFS